MVKDPWNSSALFGTELPIQKRRDARRRGKPLTDAIAISSVLQDVNPSPLMGDEVLGSLCAQHLSVKGFCTISAGLLDRSQVGRARAEAESLEFRAVNPLIAEGLLGVEGSSSVAELKTEFPDAARPEGPSLVAVDDSLNRLWTALLPFADSIGVDMVQRGSGIVHRGGESDFIQPELCEAEVSKWQGQFLRHTLMLVAFLGPYAAIVELAPFGAEDVEPHQVNLAPGDFLVLRPDSMSHLSTTSAECIAVSCFLLAGDRRSLPVSTLLTPVVRELEEWTIQRLQEMKDREDEDSYWDPDIPRSWRKAMNHNFQTGQVTGVGGSACRFPGSPAPDCFFSSSTGGADFAIEVPLSRWDHELFYDPAPDCYLMMKTSCKHCASMDGVELFDNKFFGLSQYESQGLDPQARMLLEVGYMSLRAMGKTKKDLLNATGGSYVGISNLENSWRGGFAITGNAGGASSMNSGRISFCLGMKGSALTITTEAASGLTATLLAAESVQVKGSAVNNDFAIGIGVHLLLSPVWWPNDTMSGALSVQGRCKTFDAQADGYIRGDGCASVAVENAHEIVDGKAVRRNGRRQIGNIAGGFMSNSGRAASMTAPNAAAEQQVAAEAIRNAGLTPTDIDGVEAFGSGGFLSDAVEARALLRSHRDEGEEDRLMLTAVKSSVGNQVDCAGVSSLLKVLLAANFGFQTPTLHLWQVNPNIDPFEQPLDILSEASEFPFRSTFNGAKARGAGGANVFVVAWGERTVDQPATTEQDPALQFPERPSLEQLLARRENAQRSLPAFWPGGGGRLPDGSYPSLKGGYFLVGTWSRWRKPQQMKQERPNLFSCLFTIGESRWEKFQIWLDGDAEKVLHPGQPKMHKASGVLGPTVPGDEFPSAVSSIFAPTWMVNGRSWREQSSEEADAQLENPDLGMPGDQYKVSLEIVGKWRRVTWERVEGRQHTLVTSDGSSTRADESHLHRYYVAGDWNNWGFEEMSSDANTPRLWTFDVSRKWMGRGEFQIVKDQDWDQIVSPGSKETCDAACSEDFGPDDYGSGTVWSFPAASDTTIRIEYKQTVKSENAFHHLISWREIPPEHQ